MTRSITLVGVDCGSTTTSAVAATACLATGAGGRVEITQVQPIFRSELEFTPFDGPRIDAARLASLIDSWLSKAGVNAAQIFGGGALVTGLAAERENAATIVELLEKRLGESVVAAADDPRLESWLAFMGNCHALSRSLGAKPILNLDIGGGTTNLALGVDGAVTATGCLMVGARHFQFTPGTYQLTGLSPYAAALLDELKVARHVGQTLEPDEIAAIVDFNVDLLEATIEGKDSRRNSPLGERYVKAPFSGPALDAAPAITLSGGVGALVYEVLQGGLTDETTRYGDLGGELAKGIASSALIKRRMQGLLPEGLGRATVFGLLAHGAEASGATLYLPRPERLPLKNVPIVGRIGTRSTAADIARVLELAGQAAAAGCVRVDFDLRELEQLRAIAAQIGDALTERPFPAGRVLVLLAAGNVGKVLGNYITRWGTLPIDLIVVDEVSSREAQFVRIGKPREGIVPVSLYAIR
jgi:ethanolamine utilization protein EutA